MLRAILASTALLLASLSSVAGPTNVVLRTTAEVRALSREEMQKGLPVELEGQVIRKLFQNELIIRDATGCYNLTGYSLRNITIGDILRIKANTFVGATLKQCYLQAADVRIIGHAAPPAPKPTTAANIASGLENYNLVSVRGYVSEVIADEVNPLWSYMVIRQGDSPLCISVPNVGKSSIPLHDLIDVDVELCGIAQPNYCAYRMFVGPHLELQSQSDITVLAPPGDPFAVPRLDDVLHVSPREIVKMRRRRCEGRVLAVWSRDRFLIKENDGRLMRVILEPKQKCPSIGCEVEVVGFPQTDIFRLNLSRAVWRMKKPSFVPVPPETPEETCAAQILLDKDGQERLDQSLFGKLITLRGIVRSLPAVGISDRQINIDCDGFLIPIDVTALPAADESLTIGCEIAATGICIMEASDWRIDNLFPIIGGFTLVPRSPEDIVILSRPSWWTPVRLLVVIVSLFAALIAFFVWNRILNRLVERRGRQLFKEQVAHAGTSLKIGERTRLAVELHDSLSQNLAGLACQIAAAKSAVTISPAETRKYLCTAEQMLLSSRTELRRCLWDLRGDTLELDDMTEAVTKTVKPVIGSAVLQVRFNVPRTRLLDSTAHSILCIVRELAANAVRHGHATYVRIAGEIHDSTLSFSVRDNGGGFDVGNHPGLTDGHFGLTGIRERVDRLDGTFNLKSDTTGTNARVTLSVPHTLETEPDDKP